MSLRYKVSKEDNGTYTFTTDYHLEYQVFFTSCPMKDGEDNEHMAYSIGFERSGIYQVEKFTFDFDEKIKLTIVHVIREFFKVNGETVLLYFCFPEDGYARHRSIAFGKWYREELAQEMSHFRKTLTFKEETLYVGMLVANGNPLQPLISDALDGYMEELMQLKQGG